MALNKAEQEAQDRHADYEKQREKDGVEVHLPRSGEPGAPNYVPPDKKKASGT